MKTMPSWKTLKKDILLQTPWFTIVKKQMIAPTGAPADYYIHDAPDSVICVCVTDDNKILIERQYRPPIQKMSVDYPAGRVEITDKSPHAAILRELTEETGYTAHETTHLGVLDQAPGFSSSRIHVYLVRGKLDDHPHPDQTESIRVNAVKPDHVIELIQNGDMSCQSCVSATYLAFLKLGWIKTDL